MPNRAQPSDILRTAYTMYGSRWTCGGAEVRIRKVVHWANPKETLVDTHNIRQLLLRHRGFPIETKKIRDVVVYERDATVRTVPVVHVRICRRSARLRKDRPAYRGLPDVKKECFICRREKTYLLYKCNTCTFRTCRGCWEKVGLDCPQCRQGMMPYNMGDRL